jgi:Carboxypeptidase regulatory-like domain/TonB dependent receptor-like, beta-barrel
MRSQLFAAGLFLFSLAAFGQSDRGSITGTIADPAGAVVASAKIEAKNVATGAVYQVASTDTGNYTLSQLPAGTYEMSVTVTGFKKFIRPNLVVQVAGTLRIDVVLEVGATSESVTVTEATPLLKTESGELSHNVTTERLDNLPAITLGNAGGLGNIRNPLQAVTLLPGTQFANDNTLRVNGMPSSTYSIRVEGQDATNGIHREFTQVNQAGMDAIQEVSVQVSNYSAEFGQAGGGYFNYTMKSGTNQFHGSAYDYLVNEALNAPTPYTDDGTGHHLRNRQRRNDYGFTFGGPVAIPKLYDGHDKTFFFFNFEQFRETQRVSTGLDTVPTLDYRNGDFSGALLGRLTIAGQPASDANGTAVFQNQIFNPNTTREVNGATVRDPYVNNTIPKTDMDPVALKIQALYPAPTGTRATQAINNYEAPAYDNFRHTTIPSIKLDHNLSSRIKIAGYYSQTRAFSPQVNDFQGPFTSSVIQDSKSHTVRINYDQSITPTMLLHLGVGLLYTTQPNLTPAFDQTSLGWSKNFAAPTIFPWLSIGSDRSKGGMSYTGGIFNPYAYLEDIKPTQNASLTWVKGNHTYKMGGEMIFEGFPNLSYSRANGNIGFGAQQTADPWEPGRGLNAATGFSYASFLLGRSASLNHGTGSSNRLGSHALGLYIQDTWKVTRKFTLDYGLRYDYVTLLKEQYGRMQDAAFSTPNPVAGNRLGSVIYQATCNCSYNHNYPWALGPRLGAAYQITPKTVLRAGVGVSYGTAPNQAGLSPNVGDFYTVSPTAYGEPATLLQDGNPYAVGNRFGNAPIFWPDFRPNYPSETAPGVRPPQSPFIFVDRNSGRPPRILQWSIGLQRELTKNLVVEATYVGNRGVWWTSPLLSTYGYNALTPEGLLSTYGIDTSKAADRSLLVTPISSPTVTSRFPWLANPDNVYPGFPGGQLLNQALRPYPQWGGVPPFLGPPLGVTWYDSLQAKVTERLSHGLSVDTAFTWQKEQNLGVSSDTSYLTPAPNLINDVFNYAQNKQISAFSRPFMLVITATYVTPGFAADSTGLKVLSWLARDWSLGTLLRYQSGQVIRTPPSNNSFFTQLARVQNPATFGGSDTFYNRVAGQPLLSVDPNCKCFDPTTQLVLNPAAWTDAPAGTYGTAAPYYNDYRWQRQPAESLSIGRNFRIREKMTVSVRAEFQNVFNRLFLANPMLVSASSSPFVIGAGAPNPASPTVRVSGTQTLSSGYGFVSTFNGGAAQPRTGQIVARFSF